MFMIRRLNIVRMSVLPKLIYGFSAISVIILGSYFVDIDKMCLQFIWRDKCPRMANTILKEKNKVETR